MHIEKRGLENVMICYLDRLLGYRTCRLLEITITHHDRHKGETSWANKQIFIDVVRLRKRDPWVGWAGSFLTLLTRDC